VQVEEDAGAARRPGRVGVGAAGMAASSIQDRRGDEELCIGKRAVGRSRKRRERIEGRE
jgi:hypothetical protein